VLGAFLYEFIGREVPAPAVASQNARAKVGADA
jgi:hypothetical protein